MSRSPLRSGRLPKLCFASLFRLFSLLFTALNNEVPTQPWLTPSAATIPPLARGAEPRGLRQPPMLTRIRPNSKRRPLARMVSEQRHRHNLCPNLPLLRISRGKCEIRRSNMAGLNADHSADNPCSGYPKRVCRQLPYVWLASLSLKWCRLIDLQLQLYLALDES